MVQMLGLCRMKVDIDWGVREAGESVDKTWWVMDKVA